MFYPAYIKYMTKQISMYNLVDIEKEKLISYLKVGIVMNMLLIFK